MNDPSKFDIYQRSDFLERFLLEDLDTNQNIQMSILNGFKYDLITNMPGI